MAHFQCSRVVGEAEHQENAPDEHAFGVREGRGEGGKERVPNTMNTPKEGCLCRDVRGRVVIGGRRGSGG